MSEKQDNSKLNIFLHCFKAGVISYLLFLMLSAVFSYLSLKNMMLKNNMFIVCLTLLCLCALLCGYISAIRQKAKGVICGSFSSIILMILIYITLAVSSSMTFTNKCVLIIPICLIFGIIGAIINKNKRHKK